MSPALKAALIALIGAAITFLTVWLVELQGETLKLSGATNEVLGFRLQPKSCDGSAQSFTITPTVTTQPSYEGARVGEWDDILTEGCNTTEEHWVDYKITLPHGEYDLTILGHSVKLTVYNFTIPDQPSLPLSIQLLPWDYHKSIGDLNQRDKGYLDVYEVLKAHRITPMKTWVSRSNLDETFALDLPITIVPITTTNPQTDEYVAEINQRCVDRKCVAWLQDEPPASSFPAIKALATRMTAYPNIQTMVTTKYTEELADVDIFTEVLHPGFLSARIDWGYTSCMAHGCGPSTGQSTGAPDLVLDRHSLYARVLHWVGYHLRLEAVLYYNAVEGLGRPPIYRWTGNREGQLLYGPGFKQQSLRLKYLRRGSYDYEYLKAAGADVSSLIRSPFDWDKDESKYDAMIKEIGASL